MWVKLVDRKGFIKYLAMDGVPLPYYRVPVPPPIDCRMTSSSKIREIQTATFRRKRIDMNEALVEYEEIEE